MVRRVAWAVIVGVLFAASCSSGDDGPAGSPDGGAAGSDAPVVDLDDTAALLCTRWAEFAELMDGDAEPSDELVDEVLERQRGIDEVLPDELAEAWADITSWNMAFIEFFGAAGYREITDEVMVAVYGDQEAAEGAADAAEAGFQTMTAWSDRNCAVGEGDAAAFCTAWTDISDLLVHLDEEPPTQDLVDELFAHYDEVDPDVPEEIRDHWDALLAFAAPFRDLLVTVEYDLDRVSDEILVQAFGSLDEVETLEGAAEAGEEAIDAWSLEGCGDFCSRWDETRRALDETSWDIGWVKDDPENGPMRYQELLTQLETADQLVPAELAAQWSSLRDVHRRRLDAWEQLDFDRSRMESSEGREAALAAASEQWFVEIVRELEREMVPEEDLEEHLAYVMSEALSDPGWVHGFWQGGVGEWLGRRVGEVDRWVDANCAVDGGRPGIVRVQMPVIEGAAGDTLVLGIGPRGSTVEDFTDPGALLAGDCQGVGSDPWGYGVDVDDEGNEHRWYHETEGLRSERWDDRLCDFRWEEGPAQLEAGPYTLLAALVEGAVAGRSIAAEPTACVALDIQVDGDTLVPLPALEPCDANLSSLVVNPEPWMMPEPVDPSILGPGTLRVAVPNLVLPEEIAGEHGDLAIVVLPAGTTLNEVGREEVWPSGGFRTGLERRNEQPHIQELLRLGSVAVPIMAVPPTGALGWFDSWWLAEATPEKLPLTLLAPGDYDVHVQISGYSDEGEDRRCGRTTVTIDGDTVVDMPELGECP